MGLQNDNPVFWNYVDSHCALIYCFTFCTLVTEANKGRTTFQPGEGKGEHFVIQLQIGRNSPWSFLPLHVHQTGFVNPHAQVREVRG